MGAKYPPPYHQSHDREKMIEVIKNYPLGMLVTNGDGVPYVTHIPIIYNEDNGRLVAHIDKFNPQVSTLTDGAEVLVVFRGPDAYISPSVYTTTQLPTWNYIFVHVKGRVRRINDPEAAKGTMIAMTAFLEQPDHRFVLEKDNPKMAHAVNYIQAFDIEITEWEGKFKLSQDKIEKDQTNAKQALLDAWGSRHLDLIEEIYRE